MRLRVDWIEDESYVDGGAYALCMANGHLFAELAQKGRNENAHRRAWQIANAYNEQMDRIKKMSPVIQKAFE